VFEFGGLRPGRLSRDAPPVTYPATPVNSLLTQNRWLGLLAGLSFLVPLSLPAADALPVRGPFWSGTIMRAKDQPAALKGLAITLGAAKTNYVVYDLDTMRMAVAWSGEFLEFGNTLTKIEWPPPPSVKGTNIAVATTMGPGWADKLGNLADPRAKQQGPLPKDWAHYEGLYLNGDQVVLSYTVGGIPVLETPGVEFANGAATFTRIIQFTGAAKEATLVLADGLEGGLADSKPMTISRSALATSFSLKDSTKLSVMVEGIPASMVPGRAVDESTLQKTTDGRVLLRLGKIQANKPFKISITTGIPPTSSPIPDLRKLTKGGPARWTETPITQGKLGTEDGPYQVDTITEPFPNVYNTRTFWGGFDFLPDGRAVICAFHGDVWIVSGIDSKLDKLTWKRFATGLFQPLGVKVQKGEIYVAGRDQITRLKDLNGDGEADLYENFNNDTVVTPNYHEFVLDLHTDSKGNFYYCKGAPWEPAVTSPHQGTLLKVSPDGKKLEVYATGLRAPNGMTVGPDDTILVGDNQGHWMPSSKLNLVKPGAFMGMTPAAQHELTLRYPDGREIKVNPSDPAARKANNLKGWEGAMPIPTSYDEPIAWLPMRWDNSSGGQVYVTSDKWGPWKGAPLFMSYGKCLLYGVLMDDVDGTKQASLVPFNLKFASGVMRGRFSNHDGQLYVAGLKGWQNAATRDGGFYRVRYTGKPVHMPVKAHAAKNGLQLAFSTPLDGKTAEDIGSYAVELWNYKYSGNYGSSEFSVKDPTKTVHDKLEVKSAKLSADKRTLFLEVDGLQIADQFSVKYSVNAADGTELRSEVVGTIHKLGAEVTDLR
jgi:hypothetical protein